MKQSASALRNSGSLGGRLAGWLVDPDGGLPAETRLAMIHSLYRGPAIFLGGAVNMIVVSAAVAVRIPQAPFLVWAAASALIGVAYFAVLMAGRQAMAKGEYGPVGLSVLLALLWAVGVGYGMFITIMSGDWPAALLVCLSGAVAAGGICFRYIASPRLASAMIVLALAPGVAVGPATGQSILLILGLQIPICIGSMIIAVFHFNRLMVTTMLAERENERRATHDMLTGALNRAGLARDVAERMAAGEPFALFQLDLDGFKAVNDTFGHQVGDELLKAVVERLRLVAKPDAAVARIGGDAFVIVSSGSDSGEIGDFGELMVRAVADGSYRIGAEVAQVGASVGVALYPSHGRDLGTLLGEADTALYRAKFWGRTRCVIAGTATRSPAQPSRHEIERSAA